VWHHPAVLRLFTALLLLVTAALCHAGIPLEDDRGRTVTLRGPALRIVSLTPSSTETVCVLGACDRLVGVDRYSKWPQAVTALPTVGTQDHAQIESIVALRPDLVIVRPRSRVAEQLEQLGVTVLALDAKTQADVRRILEVVARAIGKPGAGEAEWQRIEARLATAASRVPAGWNGRQVYFEVHHGAAASASSFIGETLTRLRLGNVVPGTMGAFPKVNPEFVVRANPDLLMTSTYAEMATMTARPGWSRMSAVAKGRICAFGADRFDLMMRPGPRIGEAADELVACLARLSEGPP
jgi:iron complex transport system substrate-binding protein